MPHIQGFPPICRSDAHTLILGSMPSRESLARQKYYAHPRNSFWPIVTRLLRIATTDYAHRILQVTEGGIAIWDVLQACTRHNSLDSDIDDRSIVTNDFRTFFEEHPGITRVFFNGAKAESVYRMHVLPGLLPRQAEIGLQRLPSTSPANAGMTVEGKLEKWRAIVAA
ncbi:MAG: DNA-deoxyinosine glycosylase [Xanthomonadales bacterium]